MSAGCVRRSCAPADRQQKGTLVNRLKAVRHALSHSHQQARDQTDGLIADSQVHTALEPMQRNRCVSVVLVHLATGLESDQHNSHAWLFGNCVGSVVRCRIGFAAPQPRYLRDAIDHDQRITDMMGTLSRCLERIHFHGVTSSG